MFKHTERNGKNHDENQYLNLIQYIIENGVIINGRNGNVLTVIGCPMHFNLLENTIPILTTKKVAWKTCAHYYLKYIKLFNYLRIVIFIVL